MNTVFFGAPFKAAILVLVFIFLGLFGFNSPKIDAQKWQDERLLLDLKSGGAELFKETSPSIIQLTNTSLDMGGGLIGGSGYVIDKEGHAITNWHNFAGFRTKLCEVAFFSEDEIIKWHRGVLIGSDPSLDLAVIKIDTDPANLHPIKLADSDKMKLGDAIATAGSPGGDVGVVDWGNFLAHWVDYFNYNIGIVDEVIDFPHALMWYTYLSGGEMGQLYGSGVQYLFHVSAAINHGNSGGPAINAYGEAIGTNTWGGGGENYGLSVPSNLLKRSTREIIEYGRPMTPWCGIICHPPIVPYKWYNHDRPLGITNEWQLWFDVEPEKIVINHVNPYSPAYKAGLKKDDVILSVDNKKFINVFDLYKYFLNGRIGQKVTFIVERNGVGIPPVTVELEEKKVRYDTITINTYTMYEYITPYNVTLTY